MLLVEPLAKNYDNTHIRVCITVKISRNIVHIFGPLTVCLDLGQAVTCNSEARCSPRTYDPVLTSIARIESPFGYKASTHIIRHLFSLPYFSFHTSVSILWFPHFSIFHLPGITYYNKTHLSHSHICFPYNV